jgi:hypothetical protein
MGERFLNLGTISMILRGKEWLFMGRVCSAALLAATLLVFTESGSRADEYCSSDAAQLQAHLIDAQTNGEDDIIRVVRGTYMGHFPYIANEGKGITLLGGYGEGCTERVVDPARTVLDGGEEDNVLYFYVAGASDGVYVTIDGFTIRKGNTIASGGGIYVYATSVDERSADITLSNNIIEGNFAGGSGGGVSLTSASNSGDSGNIALNNNIFSANTADQWYGGGAMIQTRSDSGNIGSVLVTNNTFTGNQVNRFGHGGGIYLAMFGGVFNLYNNIIWGNLAPWENGKDIYLYNHGSIDSTVNAYHNDYSSILGAWTDSGNNIDQDPMFLDAANGDFHLLKGSPCVDVGTNGAPGIPARDFEDQGRILDGDMDGLAVVDMGADEYIRRQVSMDWSILLLGN